MRDPKTLRVFEKADELVLAVYRVTMCMPSEEKFSLTSQIRRAAVSIPSNLAEGCSRESTRDFARFVEIALGSAMELEYQLGLAQRLVGSKRDAVVEVAKASTNSEEAVDVFIRRTQATVQAFIPVVQQASEVVRMLISFGKTLRSEL